MEQYKILEKNTSNETEYYGKLKIKAIQKTARSAVKEILNYKMETLTERKSNEKNHKIFGKSNSLKLEKNEYILYCKKFGKCM